MRYSRQAQVPQLTHSQNHLNNAKIVIIGAGGLGCVVGSQLAGAGVGSITLVDHDVIDISNLHRQLLFRENDIDQPKAAVLARELLRINSSIQVQAVESKLTPNNVMQIITDADCIIDAADNFACSYVLSDACLATRTPLLTASVNQTYGYVGLFCALQYKTLPSLRAAFPKLSALQANCDTVGVTGPSVGLIGSVQAQEALKVLINNPDVLAASILYFDCWHYQAQHINLSQASEPTGNQVQFVALGDITASTLVFDVRSMAEQETQPFAFEHVITAPPIDSTIPVVCACRTGQRALAAAQQLLQAGFSDVAVLVS